MKSILKFIQFLVAVMALAGCSAKYEMTVSEVWARPGIAGGNSGAFFLIDNQTGSDDRLLDAHSEVAESLELHQTVMTDGVMQMVRQEAVEVPAGEQVIFKPGDLHVMLINLIGDLNPGDTFELTLVFENAGEITVQVMTEEP